MPSQPSEKEENSEWIGFRIHFIIPDSSKAAGYSGMGTFISHSPPRSGEIVTLGTAFGASASRFRVAEVIHHYPPLDQSHFPLCDITVLVLHVVSDGDIDTVVRNLCHPAARSAAKKRA